MNFTGTPWTIVWFIVIVLVIVWFLRLVGIL